MIVLKKWAKIKTSRTAAFLFGCVGQARQMVVDLCDPHLPPTPCTTFSSLTIVRHFVSWQLSLATLLADNRRLEHR